MNRILTTTRVCVILRGKMNTHTRWEFCVMAAEIYLCKLTATSNKYFEIVEVEEEQITIGPRDRATRLSGIDQI